MKKLFILCCFFAVTLTIHADGWIDFQTRYRNPNPASTRKQRAPIQPPHIYLEDYSLSFNAFEEECLIQLLDNSGNEVFSGVIPVGTTSFQLPTTLEGEYQIQLIYSVFIFIGYIYQ
jgi:hypothetical protein